MSVPESTGSSKYLADSPFVLASSNTSWTHPFLRRRTGGADGVRLDFPPRFRRCCVSTSERTRPGGCDNRPFTHSRAAAARCSRPASCTESAPRPLFDAVSVPASMTSAGRTISHQRMTEVAETHSPLKESRRGASTDQVQFVSIGTVNKNPAQRHSSFALTMSLAHELSSSGFCDRSSF